MKVSYSSNNSGGKWWLTDENWRALEAAGWVVDWVKAPSTPRMSLEEMRTDDNDKAIREEKLHRMVDWMGKGLEDGVWRYMGALARDATIEAETPGAAMRSFEAATGLKVSDNGCNCCGPPHCFTWGDGAKAGYASGEDCLRYLFPGRAVPRDLREAMEREP